MSLETLPNELIIEIASYFRYDIVQKSNLTMGLMRVNKKFLTLDYQDLPRQIRFYRNSKGPVLKKLFWLGKMTEFVFPPADLLDILPEGLKFLSLREEHTSFFPRKNELPKTLSKFVFTGSEEQKEHVLSKIEATGKLLICRIDPDEDKDEVEKFIY